MANMLLIGGGVEIIRVLLRCINLDFLLLQN